MKTLLEEAQELYNDGNKVGALRKYKELLIVNPNVAEAWYGISKCDDDIENKFYCLNRAISINPSYDEAIDTLWLLKMRTNKTNDYKLSQKIPPNLPWSIIDSEINPPKKEMDDILPPESKNQAEGIPNPPEQTSIEGITPLTKSNVIIQQYGVKSSKKNWIPFVALGIFFLIISLILINFQKDYSSFMKEATKLDDMTNAGVFKNDFSNQLSEVKWSFSKVKNEILLLMPIRRNNLVKAIYGWDLALEVWNDSINYKLSENILIYPEYSSKISDYLKPNDLFDYFGLEHDESELVSAILVKASNYFNSGLGAKK